MRQRLRSQAVFRLAGLAICCAALTTALPAATIRMIGHMQATFPKLIPRLPPDKRFEALVLLDKARRNLKPEDLRPTMEDLYSTVSQLLKDQEAQP
jgi:hypothetical protein